MSDAIERRTQEDVGVAAGVRGFLALLALSQQVVDVRKYRFEVRLGTCIGGEAVSPRLLTPVPRVFSSPCRSIILLPLVLIAEGFISSRME